jgi:uncharacterized membrane protein
MSKYSKFIAAALTPLVLVAVAKLAASIGVDVTLDEEKVNEFIVAAVTAASVYLIPNEPT